MSDPHKTLPSSLDTLLSETRQHFDNLFSDQMAGGRTVRAAPERTSASEAAAPATMAEPTPPAGRGPVVAGVPGAPLDRGPVDAVAVGRLAGALANIRREAETGFLRSALPGASPCKAMIMDGGGRLISGIGGAFLAHMLGSGSLHIAAGDVLLLGDPVSSAGATAGAGAIMAICPIGAGGGMTGYVSIHGRLRDVGGTAPGSAPADARSIHAEGLRIPPIKIYNGGVLNQCALDLILTNGRNPDANRADLMALIAAAHHAAARVEALALGIGAERFHQTGSALLAQTQTMMAGLIQRAIREEPQSFDDVIDDDGLGNGPFPLRLTVWREGAHAYFDWTGTAAEAPGPVNLPLHIGRAKALIARCIATSMGAEAPGNEGGDDLLHVTLPGGSLLCPDASAPVGRHAQTLARVRAMLQAAINRHDPARLHAAGGDAAAFVFSGEGFDLTETIPAGGPAMPHADGTDGHAEMVATGLPAEEIEADYPVLIEALSSVPGSGGAGLCRGGNGVERIYRFLAPGQIALHTDRHVSQPWGVHGGHAGACASAWLVRADGGRDPVPAKIDHLPVQPGDRLVVRTAGGGGAGDPLARDPVHVLNDVATGMVTVEDARSAYGVIVDDGRIDQRATDALRMGLTRERTQPALFHRGNGA